MAKKNPKPISIAMVAFNEAKTIASVIDEYYSDIVTKLPKKSEFLLYLDKPTDGTDKIVRNLKKNFSKLKVIYAKKNLGYAQAMSQALKATKHEIIFYSDSSGKHRAKDFWNMLPYIEKFDIVTGERTSRSDPMIRQIITFLQRILVVSLFQVPFFDYNTGFKIIKRSVITKVVPSVRYTKQSFSTELLIRSLKRKFSVVGVPVSFVARKTSGQGTNFKQLPSIIWHNAKGLFLLRLELFQTNEN